MQEQHSAKLGLKRQVHHSRSHLKENSDCLVTDNIIIHVMCYSLLSLPEVRVGGHGYSSRLVCLSVCNFRICSPGCHSTAFIAWIAFTQ